ncbi:MAG TPA: ABC transporter ATP-binding protein [Cytophagaceae bacterium]|jgi:putative ABC transport system ATP-binding protein|nr:ABC transporter ATP-binding protein [Cytophagaceae bacterium]
MSIIDDKVVARVEGASKRYKSGDGEITALYETNFEMKRGELVLIIGPSGSGKTTLLSLLGCVIYPTTGKVVVEDSNTTGMNETQLAQIRLKSIGFVFQNFNLVAPLTALENVMFPLNLQKISTSEALQRARKALEGVGLSDRADFKPKQLSGGQQQRVAIARALVTNPALLLCDEPTASLDSKSLVTVMEELKKLSKQGKAVAVVTHDPRLKEYADRTIYVENGRVTNEPFAEGH